VRLEPSAAASPSARLPWLDAARGIAILAMVIYHFSWDLRYFGFIAADVAGDLGWRIFARLIASSFLALVGVSLVLATRNGLRLDRYLRRLALIVVAAGGITLVTWFAFPESYIFFGILHAIAVSSVLGLAFVRAPVLMVLAAALFCLAAPPLFAGPAFDAPALLWLGLATYQPRSNDFVPLFPWFGIVLLGIAAARLAPLLRDANDRLQHFRPGAVRPLAWAGRHSLGIYLVHQPLLFGLVYLAAQVAPPSFAGFEPSYVESCTTFCAETGMDERMCRRTCECLVERTKAEGLWGGVMRNDLGKAETARYQALADLCRAASS
jgi:uncharacterized membrane protein